MQEQNNNYGQQPQPQQPPPQPQYQAPPQQQYQQPQYQQQPPPGYPPQQPPPPYGNMPPEMAAVQDVNDNKLMAILSYFSLLWLVPFLTKTHEKSPFVKFHLNQGILLIGMQIVYWIVWALLGLFRTAVYIPSLLGPIPTGVYTRPVWVVLITSALSIFIGVLAIIGIVNAAKGEQKKLPLVGDLFTLFK